MRKNIAVGVCIGCAIVGLTGIAFAQLHETPAGPHALKGDILPPFGMVDDNGHFTPTPETIPGITLGPNRPPETTARGPSLRLATKAAQVALDSCLAEGYRVGVAVIDSEGQARVFLNADGTDGSHGFVAMRKAEAALAFNMASSETNTRAQRDPVMLKRVTPSMLLDGGAVPLIAGATVYGAIGVSGAAGKIIGEQDEICARRGRDAVQAELANAQ